MNVEERGTDSEPRFFTRIALLTGTGVYLYFNLFIWPRIPILLSGDQLFFWMNGQRILHGELPYRDFFQFTPPGADLIYFAIFRAFGARIWVLDVLVLLLGVALSWACFEIARRIMPAHFAALAALLFLTLIYSPLLNATHHWFSVLAIMIAVVIMMRSFTERRLAIAGVLLGTACFFTQTHAIVAVLSILFFLRYRNTELRQTFWRAAAVLLAGFAFTWLALNAYFIARVGLERMLYCQVYYVLRVMVHRPETPLLGMPELRSFADRRPIVLAYQYIEYAFVYALLPVTYVVCLLRFRRRPTAARADWQVALIALIGFALLAELAFSLNWLRLYTVSMPGIVLFVYLIQRAKARRVLRVSVTSAVVLLGVQHLVSTQQHNYVTAELAAGRCAMEPAEFEKLTWLTQRTSAGDFLFAANWPGVYIPLDLRNPVFLDTAGTVLNSQWDGQAVQQLEAKQVRYVLWAGRFETMTGTANAHIAPLRSYVHETYREVRIFADGEQLWERK